MLVWYFFKLVLFIQLNHRSLIATISGLSQKFYYCHIIDICHDYRISIDRMYGQHSNMR